MPSLTKKQIRNARPVDQLPFEVERKYGVPALYAKPADVRTALAKDVKDMRDRAALYGSAADRERLGHLEGLVQAIGDATEWPLSFDVLVDGYSGVRYQVTVRDRRMP